MLKILLIEDIPDDADLVAQQLRREGLVFSLTRVSTKEEMEREFRAGTPDLILADYTLPAINGIAVLRIARVLCPNVPFIFVSGEASDERAVEALKHGATDYIFKLNLTRLVPSIKRALREAAERNLARKAEHARKIYRERQSKLLEISLEMLSETSLDGMLPSITKSACVLTGGKMGMTAYGTSCDSLRFFAATGTGEPLPAGSGMLPVEKGGVNLALLKSVDVLNLTDEMLRSHSEWWGMSHDHLLPRGLLGARLTDEDGNACGLIMVSDKQDGSDFTDEDQILLNQLAAVTSLTMRNLAAREALQSGRDELERRVGERTAELAHTVAALQGEIAERKQAESELLKSQERNALVAIGANDGIWDWDIASGQVYFSARWKGMFGYEEYEISNSIDEWKKRIHPEDYDSVMAALDDHLKGESPLFQVEYRMLHKNGEYRWILTRGASFRDIRKKSYRMAGSHTDITEKKRADEKLLASHESLRNLSSHLESLMEKERKNISREIHDEVGQLLTALKFDVSWLAGRLPANRPALSEKARSMADLIDMTVETVQRIATELRPRLLYDLGLATAMEWHADEFRKRTGIACNLALGIDESKLDPARSTALYKIYKEALTNVMRHAGASRVDVSLKKRKKGIMLQIKDNGRGIRESEINDPKSVGLIGIYERAHLWGGEVHISGVADEGTMLTVVMPMS
ncbi:PAS domain-containing protein [Geomobilimonas luticola]|uniref:PAS domain-containing protein n=1 Tax=Geomobilimonas luticola TaxID=1114878 RepID=A0ABS5SC06_9BACT|nr:PAS domain-containing protein [Geomobilimonas luticola]MBT0652911.1 PAS domain-containing protein [Geomobilimonas luticola]